METHQTAQADMDRFAVLVAKYQDEADFVGPRASLVPVAEDALGLRFPPAFRRFVSEYGAGGIGANEFYGVIDDDFENSAIPDAIWMTLDARRDWGLPDSMIVVAFEGSTRYYVIDTAKAGSNGEPPVEAWIPGVSDADSELETVFPNYVSMLVTLVEEEYERN